MARKNPYTPREFFDVIMDGIEVPDTVDYWSTGDEHPWLRNYEFEVYTDIKYGTCEGVYLDVILRGNYDGEPASMFNTLIIGSLKTLNTDEDSVKELYMLAAEIFIKANNFVSEHIDDFTWLGYNLKLNPDDKCSREISNMHRLIKKCIELEDKGEDISKITVYDYSNRKRVNRKKILKDIAKERERMRQNALPWLGEEVMNEPDVSLPWE